MESALSFIERLLLVAIGAFALYQCFLVRKKGFLARPAAGWTIRVALLLLAAVCFFTVARLAGSY
jgi:hypothetical protein